MKISTPVKILGGTALALTLIELFRLSTTKSLVIDFVKANIVGFDKVYLTLKVANPKISMVTFNSINVELFFNSINIGRLYYNKPIFINSKSEKIYVFPVILYPEGELTLLQQLIKTKAKSGIFEIKGQAMVDGITFPYKQSIKAW